MVGFGFVTNWVQLVPLRIVLGILEGGSFPGGIYLLSCWFTRFEIQRRNSYYYMIGMIASAFSGILAYGFTQMEGLAGIRGWRWIFIMEGIITCVVAIIAFWVIVDFPEKATKSFRFLNHREVDLVVARIEDDRKDVVLEEFNLRGYLANGLDVKVWSYALMFALAAIPTYGLAYFLPIILQTGLGYSVAKAQCLTAPPQATSVLVMWVQAYYGDKKQIRGPWIAINSILVLIGAPILGFATNDAVRYFGVFLCAMGAYSQVPAILTYQACNIRGQWRRAFCSASLIGLSGVGAIAGTLVFRPEDAPGYHPGLIALMVADGLVLVILGGLTLSMWRANKQADEGKRVIEGLDSFRYTL
jgi:MFS family permease